MKRWGPAIAWWLAAACGAPPEAPPWEAAVAAWTWPQPIPDVPLIDQDGRTFSLGRHRDDWVVLGWVFTRCRDGRACPMTLSRLVAIDERWRALEAGGATGGRRLALLALTLDPAWDTPERLAAFGRSHGVDPSRITLATGPQDLLARDLPAMFSILALPDAEQGLVHTVKIVLLRPGLVFEAEWKDDALDPDEVCRRVLSETPGR